MAMFKNPIAPRERKSTKEFKSPRYDNRSGPEMFMAAGDNYGLGFKQPVGKMRGGSVGDNPVPMKKLASPPSSVV